MDMSPESIGKTKKSVWMPLESGSIFYRWTQTVIDVYMAEGKTSDFTTFTRHLTLKKVKSRWVLTKNKENSKHDWSATFQYVNKQTPARWTIIKPFLQPVPVLLPKTFLKQFNLAYHAEDVHKSWKVWSQSAGQSADVRTSIPDMTKTQREHISLVWTFKE